MMKWIKQNLFSSPLNSIVSITYIVIIFNLFIPIINWLFVNSVWNGTAVDCRQASGACLAFIKEKMVFILFGFYPHELIWRPIIAMILFLALIIFSKEPKRWSFKIIKIWAVGIVIISVLMNGGIFGLESVPAQKWGGLPLTLMLSFLGVVFAYPIGIILALGRTSNLPVFKTISVIYIELIRGIPMISLLFMASVMFPLFVPDGLTMPKLLRAQIAIIMFSAAYLAEVVRGGLAAIPKGQYEAADALGLSYYQKTVLIILPQALKLMIPPTVNTVIGMFKDTSLVLIIALFDLLMTTKTALKDGSWLGFSLEAYLFVGLIYFIFCFSMGRYSKRLEIEFYKGH